MVSFPKRIFIFQFILFFVYIRLTTFDLSAQTFKKKIISLIQLAGYDRQMLNLMIGDLSHIFKVFIISYGISGILSILNFRLFQLVAGYLTCTIAFLYCNPIQTIHSNLRGSFEHTWKNYIPSMEFLVIAACGIAMIACAFSTRDNSDVKKETTTTTAKH